MVAVIVLVFVVAAAAALWFIRRKKLSDSALVGPVAQPPKRSPEN